MGHVCDGFCDIFTTDSGNGCVLELSWRGGFLESTRFLVVWSSHSLKQNLESLETLGKVSG